MSTPDRPQGEYRDAQRESIPVGQPRGGRLMRWLRRSWADTLFKRLFVLMWVGLVASHLLAFTITTRSMMPPLGDRGGAGRGLPVFPSLPPSGGPSDAPRDGAPPPPDRDHGPGGPPPDFGAANEAAREGLNGPGPGLSTAALWLDYLVRVAAIGVVAWFGARWLSAPMRRLAEASETLGRAIGQGQAAAPLDERHGTLEVRQTAQVFNAMAERLHSQFEAQALLMAAISHDLRTPLARLRMRLDTMETAPAMQAQSERCIADVREMDELIGEVLAMLRDKRAPSAPERVDLQALAQALVDDLAEQGQRAQMNDASAIDQGTALVMARPAALKRILGNLIGNALRHAGSATVSVRCVSSHTAHGGAEVQLIVDDDGPGIAADQLEAVFQPFHRLDASRSRETGGSGLGLTIARDLSQRENARLMLSNRPEGGLRALLVFQRA